MVKGQKATVIVLICGAFLSVLNQTLMNPAIPSVMSELKINATTAQWLVSGFTLVNAIVVAVSAFLMDRFATKKLFIAVFGLFLAGSLLAAWGINFPVLLAGRILQAICAGVMLPMSMTVLLLIFPHEKRGSAMGMYNFVIMFAPAMGPAISGILTDITGWHVMFLIMAVLAAIVILLAIFAMKNSGKTKQVTLDKISVAESSLGLFCLLYGFSMFGKIETMLVAGVLIVLGVGILLVFARRQFKLTEPFLELRVLFDKQFRYGIVISMLISASLAAVSLTLPIYVQTVRGFSATISGLVMVPGSILGAFGGYFAGNLHDKFGARYLSIAGVALLSLGSFGMAMWGFKTSIALMIIVYCARSFGLMLANTPINIWSINTLPDEILHHGNAVSSAMRQVASTFGVALMVSTMSLATNLFTDDNPTKSQLIGIHAAFYLSIAIAVISLVLVIVKVKDRRKTDDVSKSETVSELDAAMHPNPYTVSSDDSLERVIEKFIEYRTSGLPVIDNSRHIIGYVSDGDVLRYMAKQDVHVVGESFSLVLPDNEEFVSKAKELLQKNVLEIATKHTMTVELGTPLSEVCRLFYEHKLSKIPVTQNGVLVGTISRGDTMRYLMKRLPLNTEHKIS
ncbi:MAG: MDR family MFS transporter [Dehalobacterium sp.]